MFKIQLTFKDFFPALVRRLSNVAPLWRDITDMMNTATGEIFDNQGGVWGRQKWKPIKSTMHGKIRVGTDGRAWGFYSGASLPMQASGSWRKSFRRISMRPLSMVYGSNYSFNTKKGKVSGEVLPRAGLGGRWPLPAPKSSVFQQALENIETRFMQRTIAAAISEAATVIK